MMDRRILLGPQDPCGALWVNGETHDSQSRAGLEDQNRVWDFKHRTHQF